MSSGQRFKNAQDKFFAARSAAFSERDASLAENLAAKVALLAEAESLNPRTIRPRRGHRCEPSRTSGQRSACSAGRRDSVEKRLQAVEQSGSRHRGVTLASFQPGSKSPCHRDGGPADQVHCQAGETSSPTRGRRAMPGGSESGGSHRRSPRVDGTGRAVARRVLDLRSVAGDAICVEDALDAPHRAEDMP